MNRKTNLQQVVPFYATQVKQDINLFTGSIGQDCCCCCVAKSNDWSR